MRAHADYVLYALIGALTAAQTIKDWTDPQAYIGVCLAALVALKAKRSGSNGNEARQGKKE